MVDKNGQVLDGDVLLYIIAKFRQNRGEDLHNIVGTQMSNYGLERALEKLGIKLHRTKVGDRYVLEKLNELGARVGGENSGHIICLDRNSTGDGIITALQVLAAVLDMNKTVQEITADLHLTCQILKNVAVTDKKTALENPAVQEAIKQAEEEIAGKGRLLIRPSGTEPIIRVMAEGDEEGFLEQIVDGLIAVIRNNQ